MLAKTESTLSSLLQGMATVLPADDRVVTHLTQDSREVIPGSLFFACHGNVDDGRHYVVDAVRRGAVAIVSDAIMEQSFDIPTIVVPHLNQHIGSIASRFYGNPSHQLSVIGITGTNGKTSSTQFVANCLMEAGIRCAVMGTLGNGFLPDLTASPLTTLQASTLQQFLANFYQQGAKAVAMEVSSHGLAQHRVQGVEFTLGVFTNLTRDHLDYHGDMESYGAAKRQLFYQPGLRHGVINYDDEFGQRLLRELNGTLPVTAFSLQDHPEGLPFPAVTVRHAEFTAAGLRAFVVTPWGEGELQSSLVGHFNLSNLLAVLTCLCLLDISLKDALLYISHLTSVCGRMQTFGGGEQPRIVVDYSHTPDSLEKALSELRRTCEGQLWVVFGCGGDRDKGKRPMMGQIAEKYSDFIVLTNDNPRHENPRDIVNDILPGLTGAKEVRIELDRGKAIAYAIALAKARDVILIAGKGHETYQQVGDEKHFFSDQKQVSELLSGAKSHD